MARISMNEMTTYRWSFEEDLQHYASLGIPAVGVWRQKLSDFGEDKGAELLAESGLRVSSLSWAGGFTGSDGRSFKESVEDAREAVRVASLLQAGCLIVYTGARAGHTHKHARRILKSALAELVPVATDAGVPLALEPMHAGCACDWTFLTTLDETLDFLGEFSSPYLKIAFDTYHFGQDARIVERIAHLAAQTAIVQLGDARQAPRGEQNRCRLGDGLIPLQQIVAAFREAGYDGDYDVELLGEDIEASDYVELLRASRAAVESLIRP